MSFQAESESLGGVSVSSRSDRLPRTAVRTGSSVTWFAMKNSNCSLSNAANAAIRVGSRFGYEADDAVVR